MAYMFKELKHMKVSELRDIAKDIEHDAVQGYTQLNKDHLLEAICTALHIDMHEHHEVVGLDKGKIKKQIRELKIKRDKALDDKDRVVFLKMRKEIKNLKNTLRRATV
ncbi:hypothetical protein KAR48_11580 [bacterium]|nr:hypothetical protein [bacterium]